MFSLEMLVWPGSSGRVGRGREPCVRKLARAARAVGFDLRFFPCLPRSVETFYPRAQRIWLARLDHSHAEPDRARKVCLRCLLPEAPTEALRRTVCPSGRCVVDDRCVSPLSCPACGACAPSTHDGSACPAARMNPVPSPVSVHRLLTTQHLCAQSVADQTCRRAGSFAYGI